MVYSLLVNALPPVVLVNAVLFVTKQLNLFQVKGGISTQFSPKQIMTGKVVHYKYCSILFGQYCQISEEGTPQNSLAARTQGAIAIGPSGNVQGGHKFYTLHTASIVVQLDWKALPMPQSVIDHLNAKAQGQPTYPVFTDCHGNAFGDIAVDVGHIETVDPDVKLPGVHLLEVGESAKIPGVYADQEPKLPELNVDVGIDFNNPAPQELPLVEVEPIQANDVVHRSTREHTKPVYYQPTMTAQKYSFAATQLGKSLIEDDTYQYEPVEAFAFLQQMSLKAALKQWGRDAEMAGIKEASQLHWRNTFIPKQYSQLTNDEKTKVPESHMFVNKKRTGETKARLVGGGNKHRDYLTKEDSSSPTVATKSVLLTLVVDADEKQDVAIVDIPNAFIQTGVEDKKDQVIIQIRGVVVDWLTKIAPDIYTQYVSADRKEGKMLLVECMNVIYGTMIAGLLYYRKFAESLEHKKFIKNPYDPCVWNKVIKGKQCTICFHVDNCKI